MRDTMIMYIYNILILCKYYVLKKVLFTLATFGSIPYKGFVNSSNSKFLTIGVSVNNITFKKRIMVSFIAISLNFISGNMIAAETSASELNIDDTCTKEFLMSFFPEKLVRETLERHNVPKDQWDGIVKDLNAKDKEIIQTVEEKAAKIDPQLLKDPERRKEAVKIFRETILIAFSGVMKDHGVKDAQQIQDMLDEIQKQKAKKFAECIQKQQQQQPQQGQTPSSTPATPSVNAKPM
jgi:monomeric isocitrate dehydrogenase